MSLYCRWCARLRPLCALHPCRWRRDRRARTFTVWFDPQPTRIERARWWVVIHLMPWRHH